MNKKYNFIKLALIFITGSLLTILFFACYFIFFNSPNTPFDRIKESDILVYSDKIIINISGANIGNYANTGSMKPTLDFGSNGIRIIPINESDIHLGDIITFKRDNLLIVHRVIKIKNDVNGTYFITKGDNNQWADEKVRFSDIKYITVGVLW